MKLNKEIKQRVFGRFNGHCAYCDQKLFMYSENKNRCMTVDHFIPSAKGGNDTENNLVLSCLKCNSEKADKLPVQFVRSGEHLKLIQSKLPSKKVDNLTDTLAARKAQYGDFTDHARVAQALKEICRASPSWQNMHPFHKEALDMVMHKAGRLLCGNPNHVDSWHDIAGYARCAEERCKESSDV